MAPKIISIEDRVKTEAIPDKHGYLRQHNNFDTTKKIIKAFEDAKLMALITFDHGLLYKKEVVEFYLNATIIGDGSIKSKVNGTELIITKEDLR